MQPEGLRIARDVSLILLALEMLVLGLVPLAAFWFARRGLHAFYPKAHYGLGRANEVVAQYSGLARQALWRGSQPAIRFAGATERFFATVRHWVQRG